MTYVHGNYVYFIKPRKSYMKIKIKDFIYDFFYFTNKKKNILKNSIRLSQAHE